MKKTLFLFFILAVNASFGFNRKDVLYREPLFQLSGGMVYSSIDLSRYNRSVSYRGTHARLITHIASVFFVSAEYSTFPVHTSPSAWIDIHTRKFDLNGQVSFRTQNKLTQIYALAGVNKHEWKGTRTSFTDLGQHAKGVPEGTIIKVNRMGVNVGVGFTQWLYENLGLFGDVRFCFGDANDFEKVRIYDVMTTIGFSYSINHPEKTNGKKTYGIGKKLYKWTNKGAK